MLSLTPLNRNSVQKRNNSDMFDLYNIFDDFFNSDGFFGRSNNIGQFRIDLKDEGSNYAVEAELPGFKKEEISIDYEDGRLMISANHNEEIKEEKENYLHRERKTCAMRRSIFLKDIKPEEIEAKLEDGILKIQVPKLISPSNRKTIEIK